MAFMVMAQDCWLTKHEADIRGPSTLSSWAEICVNVTSLISADAVQPTRMLYPDFCCNYRDGERISFFEIMMRGRSKTEIVIGLKDKYEALPNINPKDKTSRMYSQENVEAFIVLAENMD